MTAAMEYATPSAQLNESSSSAVWQIVDGVATTQSPLLLGQTYHAPQNDQVTLTFTKLPPNPGTLTIKQVTVSQLNNTGLNPVTDTAYDITSTMEDGTFEYTLTLPTPTTQNVEVKASEDGQNFVTLGGVSPGDGILTITGLNHFTVFVVTGTISSSTATPFDETGSSILINEFMFDPDDGSDWVELYNRSSTTVDLTNWKLDDNTSTMTTLSGSLPAKGFLAFNVSNRLDASSPNGDTIKLINAQGTLVSQVSYKDATTINGAQNIGDVEEGQSVGRQTDGAYFWQVFEDPTKGYNNDADESGLTYITVGGIYPYSSIQEAIDNLENGGTIYVTAGGYGETLEIGRSLTLKGAGKGKSTIVGGDCSGNPTLSIDADDIIIQDFTIDKGNCGGSVIKIENELSGIVIQGNELVNGYYGIEASGVEGSLTISDNTITDNESTGLYLSGGGNQISDSTVTISGNTISSNDGNGIYADVITSSTFNVLNNTISENEGNGIYICAAGECRNSTLNIKGNSISGNDSNGLYLYEIFSSTVSIDDNEVLNNNETGVYIQYVGAVEDSENPSTVTILNNGVSSNGNYGIYLNDTDETSQVIIGSANTISQNNNAGIYLNSGVRGVSITGNTIIGNGGEEEGESLFTGIVVRSATGNEAHRNVISGNGVGVQNNDEENFFDATENFWGHLSGPLDTDLNPAGQGDSISGNVLFSPFYLDAQLTKLETLDFTTFDMNSLIQNGIFKIPDNEEGEALVQFLTVTQDADFKVPGVNGEEVTLPEGTRIERSDDQEFEWDDLTVSDFSEDSIQGLGADFDPEGALQWGIPNVELEFDKPITIDIAVSQSLNGKTLKVQRSTSSSGGWTASGIVAPGTCVVIAGICTFQATKASYFVASSTVPTPTPTPTPTPAPAATSSSSSSSGGGGGGGSASPPVCNDAKPGSTPVLTGATAATNSITLNWTESKDPLTYYLITYGLSSNNPQYGNPNIGGKGTTKFTVQNLSGGQTYYFRVRAGNGCMPGDFSNELTATSAGGVVTGPAVGFAPGILATTSEQNVGIGEVTASAQPSASSQPKAGGSPFNAKVALVVVVLLLGGFGLFRLLFK